MRLVREALAPARSPFIEGCGIGELSPDAVVVGISGGIAQPAEGESEVGLILGHGIEHILHQCFVAVARGEQADLLAQSGLIGGGEFFRECAERELRLLDRLVLVVGKQRQQAFGQPRQIPHRDARLVGIGVAAHLVDR